MSKERMAVRQAARFIEDMMEHIPEEFVNDAVKVVSDLRTVANRMEDDRRG